MLKKSNVWTNIAVWTSSWSSDDNKLAEFFRIHTLLKQMQLVLALQYLTNLSFMVLSSLVKRDDRSLVVHLLEPAVNRCLHGDSCNLGIQCGYRRF